MLKFKRFRLMDQAGDPAPAGAPAAAPATDPAAAAPVSAPAATPSLLQTGATDPNTPSNDFIPEKLRVTNAEGVLDLDASSRKMAEAYGALEKRLGSGDAPPAAAGDYKITVPDALKEAFDPATDTGMQGFLDGAHKVGLNQAQVDFVMGQYFTMAPQLAAGSVLLDEAGARAELQKTWATDADFKRNLTNAHVGATAIAQKAGLNVDEIMNGPLGNSVPFMRLMAAIGPEFKEDSAPGGNVMTSDSDIAALLASEAYNNPRHAEHEKVSAQARKYFERKHGTEVAG